MDWIAYSIITCNVIILIDPIFTRRNSSPYTKYTPNHRQAFLGAPKGRDTCVQEYGLPYPAAGNKSQLRVAAAAQLDLVPPPPT